MWRRWRRCSPQSWARRPATFTEAFKLRPKTERRSPRKQTIVRGGDYYVGTSYTRCRADDHAERYTSVWRREWSQGASRGRKYVRP